MVSDALPFREPFGLPWRTVAWSTGAAAAVGVVYAWSPMLVWFAMAMALLLKHAGKDLSPRERRWVWGLLVVALGLRLLVVAGFFLYTDHFALQFGSMFGDGRYAKGRSLWMVNAWLGKPIGPRYLDALWVIGYGWTGYHFLLAYVQLLLGATPYGVHLLNIGFFLSGAVMLYRLSRSAFGPAPAVAAFGAILFLPTLFVWSVSDLKEAFQLFLVSSSLTAIVAAHRTHGLARRAAAVLFLCAALAVLMTVRRGALGTFVLGAVCGWACSAVAAHWRRLPYALVPLVVAAVLIAWTPTLANGVSNRIVREFRPLAMTHIGNVSTTGNSYKLFEQKFYPNYHDQDQYLFSGSCAFHLCELTFGAAARFVIRGAAAFVFVPAPWQIASVSELGVLPQQGIWYGLFLLALIGAPVALRRDPFVAGLLCGYSAVGALAIALVSGNVGTLVRHRDTVVPFMFCLSAVGGCALVRWCTIRVAGVQQSAGGR